MLGNEIHRGRSGRNIPSATQLFAIDDLPDASLPRTTSMATKAGAPVTLAQGMSRFLARRMQKRCFSQSRPHNAKYGFIGLGAMGYPMATNLRAKIAETDSLLIHDINEKATAQFVNELADKSKTSVASSVREVAEQSDHIVTVLPEPSHVQSVYDAILGASKLPPAPATGQPRLFIDCSTIDPITSRGVAAKVHETHQGEAAFVDAPMSGGVVGARAAKLTFMLGSAPEHVERAQSILSMMGARVVHLGLQCAGLSGKLANNYLLALNNIATAEAMSMGIQWGLDPKALAGMINTATGRCWPSEVNNPVPGVVETAPASRGYEGGFGIALMRKDLGLALASANEYGVKYGLGDEAMKIYEAAEKDERCKGKDFSSVYRWLEGPAPKT